MAGANGDGIHGDADRPGHPSRPASARPTCSSTTAPTRRHCATLSLNGHTVGRHHHRPEHDGFCYSWTHRDVSYPVSPGRRCSERPLASAPLVLGKHLQREVPQLWARVTPTPSVASPGGAIRFGHNDGRRFTVVGVRDPTFRATRQQRQTQLYMTRWASTPALLIRPPGNPSTPGSRASPPTPIPAALGCQGTRLFRDARTHVLILLDWDDLDRARLFAQSRRPSRGVGPLRSRPRTRLLAPG